MAEQIIPKRVTCQEDFLLQVFVIGRLAFLYHLPVKQHDLAQLLWLVLCWDYGGDDVHDDRWIVLVRYDAFDKLFHGLAFLLDCALWKLVLDLLEVWRVVAWFDEKCARRHLDLIFS